MITAEFIEELLSQESLQNRKGAYRYTARIIRELAKDQCINCRAELPVVQRDDFQYHRTPTGFSLCAAMILTVQAKALEKAADLA